MNSQEYIGFHRNACEKLIEITRKKNADYAGQGTDAFANFRQIGSLVQIQNVVEIGFLTRMSDKFSRIGSFITKGELMVKDESVEDTLFDLANYCILMAGFLHDKRLAKETLQEELLNMRTGGVLSNKKITPEMIEDRFNPKNEGYVNDANS